MTARRSVLLSVVVLVGLGCVLGCVERVAAQSANVAPQAAVTVTTAATLIKAANALREALNCTNTSTSVAVRWGNSAVTSSTGQTIPAGAAIEIRNRAAIYMAAESTTAVVTCTEETK